MIKIGYLLYQSLLRTRSFVFWMVIFPVLLMVVFGGLYGGGAEEQKAPVYLHADGPLREVLEDVLN